MLNPYLGATTYFRGWDVLLRRTCASIALWGSLPLAAVLGATAAALGYEVVGVVVGGLWALTAVAVYFRLLRTPCPRCRRTFRGPSCAHCGLAAFTPYPGGKPPGKTALDYWRFRRRVRKGRCGYCGYDLRAASERCPECGEALPSRSPQLARP